MVTSASAITSIDQNSYNKPVVSDTLAESAVTADKVAAGAITLGYAQITSPFTSTVTTRVDVTGLSVTVTIPSGWTRRIEIEFWAGSWTSSGSAATAYIVEGSTTLSQVRANTPGNSSTPFTPVKASFVPTAGTHTYKAQMNQDVATTTNITAAPTAPAYITVVAK